MSSSPRPLHVVVMSEESSSAPAGPLVEAIAHAEDLLILPARGALPEHVKEEMLAVSQMAPRIGAVIPRTDGDGPNGFPTATLLHRLPRLSYVPVAAPTALWIHGTVLAEFGQIFSEGPSRRACAQFLMRINRYGYRLAVANHAFVAGGQWAGRRLMGDLASFPEAPALLERYLASPERRAEVLLGELGREDDSLSILFDLDHLAARYNGTFEAALAFVRAAAESWPAGIQIYASAHSRAWRFHHMDKLARVHRIDPHDRRLVSVVLRIGQPYTHADLARMYTRSPVVIAFMLDTISHDCGYLSLAFDADVWRFATQESDLVVTNSDYTLACLSARFPLGKDVASLVSRHSLSLDEYAQASAPLPGSKILVMGNGYFHKAVLETATALQSAALGLPVVAFGVPADATKPKGLTTYTAGDTAQAILEQLYAEAGLVVFPSHYEGFGFPILHALARRRPVVVRDTPLNRELSCRIKERVNIHFYSTTRELVELLSTPISWRCDIAEEQDREGRHTWKESANEVFAAIRRACNASASERIVRRLRRIAQARLPIEEQLEWLPTEQRLALKLAPLVRRLLHVPGLSLLRRFTRRHGSN